MSNKLAEAPLVLLDFGPKNIVAGQAFNVQPNGESAIWAKTENATKSSALFIDEIKLFSYVQDGGNLVTAYVPRWLYEYGGKYKLYIFDEKTNTKSNFLDFYVAEISGQNQKRMIMELKKNNFQLHKQLELLKNKNTLKFQGWGMTTNHALPWDDQYNWGVFRQSCLDIKQFFEFGLFNDIGINASNVDTLRWRHWIVAFTVNYALEFIENRHKEFSFIECGVGDGMSAFFALRELQAYKKKNPTKKISMHLYDAWDCMREKELLEEEYVHKGRYNDNSIERAKRNLAEFKEFTVYHKGYVPDSLANPPQPLKPVIYLHIDLNASQPTLSTLDFFSHLMVKGGVILFDDYGWDGYEKTKEIIDKFFINQPGILLKLPTGQAIYFVK